MRQHKRARAKRSLRIEARLLVWLPIAIALVAACGGKGASY
jgi:hypothetical protein